MMTQTGIILRKMRDGEEQQVFGLVEAGFDEFVLPDVTREGAEEFFRAARDMIFDKPAGHVIIIAQSRNDIVGMIDIKIDGHICLFFVTKAFQRKGIGRRLLEQAHVECARNNPTFSGMDANSSLYAVEAYKKFGFVQTKTEQISNGIRFIPMVKPT